MKKLKILLNSRLFFIIIILITFIFILFSLNNKKNSCYSSNTKIFEVKVIDYIIKDKYISITVKGKEKLQAIYYYNDINEIKNIKYGSILKVKGDLSKANNNTIFNTFNYKDYLYNDNIYYILTVKTITYIKDSNLLLYKIKNLIVNRIETYQEKTKTYLMSFLLGNTNCLNNNIKDEIKNIGISHLLALSGMHVSVFIFIISLFVNKFIKNKNLLDIIIIFFLINYLLLTNYSIGIFRITIYYCLSFINKIINFEIKSIKILFFTMFIILIINPFYILNLGFQLSFICCFSLMFFSKIINRFNNYFIKLLITSSLLFLITFPVVINTNYEINYLSIIYNFILIPYVSILLFPLTLFVFLFRFIEPVYLIIINIFEILINLFSSINSVIIIKKITITFIIVYYIILILIILNKKKIYIFLCSFILLSCLFLIKDYDYYIMYDVNQGDSLLIHINKKNILIDTGNKNIDNIILNIKSNGIRKINYLILSHGDYDHMGEAVNLVNNFKVENVIFNCGEYNDLEKKLISVLEKKNINYYSCIKELNIDKYKLQFLNTGVYDNENDNSSVIYLNYNNYKFLFMGDAGVDREKDILEKYNLKDIDFLKVGHHGSNTSSSEEFINSINPKYSLISVGKNNRYGHPKESVLDILKNSKIYRTDLDGSIEIKLNKSGYKISTCPP